MARAPRPRRRLPAGSGTRLVLDPPPRALSRGLGWYVLFGGTFALTGWLFIAFAGVFAAVFVPRTDLDFATYDRITTGTVIGAATTPTTETIQDGPRARVYRVLVEFHDHRGVRREATVYAPAHVSSREQGSSVQVEYDSSAPAHARIRGSRRGELHPGMLVLPALFLLLGVQLAVVQVVRGRRRLRLLRDGEAVYGQLVDRREGWLRVGTRDLYVLTFAYDVGATTHRLEVRTFEPAALEDDLEELLVYDPAHPARATTLDDLPGGVTIEDGALVAPGIALHLLVPPLLAAAAWAWAVVAIVA